MADRERSFTKRQQTDPNKQPVQNILIDLVISHETFIKAAVTI